MLANNDLTVINGFIELYWALLGLFILPFLPSSTRSVIGIIYNNSNGNNGTQSFILPSLMLTDRCTELC